MWKHEKNLFVVICLTIIVLYIVFTILYLGKSIIVPFMVAMLFAFAILGLSGFYERYKIPRLLSILLSLATYIFIFYIIGNITTANIDEIIKRAPEYQQKFSELLSKTFQFLKIREEEGWSQLFGNYDLQAILNYVAGTFTATLRSTGIIMLYTLFILLESRNFKKKIDMILASRFSRNHIYEIIEHSNRDIKGYFIVKTVASLMVGIGSYIVMLIFGLNFAAFWGLLLFLLNFIPYIGSIIAVMFPSILALVQPELSFYSAITLILILIIIQNIVGTIVEPRIMGNKLNLSPLVIILSLGFWGAIWGVFGMLLCVPIMVTINIILSKIPATRPIAIMLSEKGNLKIKPAFEEEQEKQGFMKKILTKK